MLPKLSRNKVKISVRKSLQRSKLKMTKVDVLIWLDYLAMMQKLASAAEEYAQSQKSNTITASHIKAVTKSIKKSCKG